MSTVDWPADRAFGVRHCRVGAFTAKSRFAGFFDASAFKAFDHPVLATSTDGVGTKGYHQNQTRFHQ